ncbi:ribonucleoside triphosphate reductase [Candidatus Bipolaricaulota bacterium]|nr:ribonucleoside triphosphate reductase [Candidatus Bipolaricaulota bacterium]
MIEYVRKRDGSLVPYERGRIVAAILSALQEVGRDDAALAQELALRVERILEGRFGPLFGPPHVEEIQDAVEEVLMTSGIPEAARAYIVYREQHKKMREVQELVDPALVESYLNGQDWRVRENSNMAFSLQGLNVFLTEKIISRYWLFQVYPRPIREAHESGDFHIHDLGTLGPYTYYGKEVVVAKHAGQLKLCSFEQLYADVPGEEILLNEADGAYAKFPKDLYVLDKDGWTRVVRLVRKAKHRPMRFIKNRGGRSVIVTDNHPMIVETGIKEALEVREDDRTFTVSWARLLAEEGLFSQEAIDLAEEIRQKGFSGPPVYLDGVPLEEASDGELLHTATFSIPRFIKLTEDFGYFVGLVLAEERLTYDEKSPRVISITSQSRELLLRANRGLLDNQLSGCLRPKEDGRWELRVTNPFLLFLFERVFEIRPGSRHKTLPVGVLNYSRDFVKGLVAGLLDGDGTMESCDTRLCLKMAARTLLEQLAVVLELLGFVPRDRAIEGQGSRRWALGREIVQKYPLYGLSVSKTRVELPEEKYQVAAVATRAWHDVDHDQWHRVINNDPVDIPDEFIYDITTESGTLVVNGMWNHNCVGWDLADLLMVGFRGARGKIESRPPKHFRTALLQAVNFLYTLQGEAAGAQAFSNVDTLFAPFIAADGLSYKEVKQALQEFIYNLNVPTRVGFQTPFTNVTLDLRPPEHLAKLPAIVGGEPLRAQYGEFEREMKMFNRAFAEIMAEGDAKGRVFTFPIPTYNVTRDFPWDDPDLSPIWEMTARYGIPYFANFINSDMRPEDTRSMCCRLRLDLRELRYRGGGLFGSNPLTGSIGVVTLNLPRLAYLSRNEREFFERLDDLLQLAGKSLIIKRKFLERLTEQGLYPYSKFYLRSIKELTGEYWKNHFSTIGVIGLNEACLNLLGCNIADPEGIAFATRVLDHLREKLVAFQEATGHLWNLEATPAEGASYRLAMLDKKRFPKIIVANEREVAERGAAPYYTNSSHLPVNYTDDLFLALRLQEPLQTRYTGGTVFHVWLGERIPSPEAAKTLVRRIFERFRIPYLTLTPTFSVCPNHGYLVGALEACPLCGERTEVYSRVVGYLRPVEQWNAGKQEEFKDRVSFASSAAILPSSLKI